VAAVDAGVPAVARHLDATFREGGNLLFVLEDARPLVAVEGADGQADRRSRGWRERAEAAGEDLLTPAAELEHLVVDGRRDEAQPVVESAHRAAPVDAEVEAPVTHLRRVDERLRVHPYVVRDRDLNEDAVGGAGVPVHHEL